MNALRISTAVLAYLSLMTASWASSISGDWVTIDDKTGKKRAVINMKVSRANELTGTIVKIYRQPGDTGICSKCPGKFKDQPTMNMQIIWNARYKGDGIWDGGQILDARSGKIYHVKMRQKGDKLYVRGYVGLPVLGRTQIWLRPDHQES